MLNFNNKIKNIFCGIVLALLCLFAGYPSLQAGILSQRDDNEQISQNATVQNPDIANIKKAFSSYTVGMYQPLATLSLSLDNKIFSGKAVGFHASSLFWHWINCLVFFFIIKKLFKSRRIALTAVCLFAVWPTQVESFTWLSARSTLISSAFIGLAILSYLHYRHTINKKFIYGIYVFYILALFTKASAISLPFILIIIEYWQDKKISYKNFLKKWPLFILSIIFGLIALKAGRLDPIHNALYRPMISWPIFYYAYAMLTQLSLLFFPANLSTVYRFPHELSTLYWSGVGLLAFLSLFFVNKNRYWRSALLFFAVIISPSLLAALNTPSIAGDRYLYLAGWPLWLGLALVYDKYQKKYQLLSNLIIVSAIFILGAISQNIATDWQNDSTVWTAVINRQPDFPEAYRTRAMANYLQGDKQLILDDFAMAAALDSKNDKYLNSVCNMYYDLKKYRAAYSCYNQVNKLAPDSPLYLYNRGLSLMQLGNQRLACQDISKAHKLGRPLDKEFKDYCHIK